MGAVHRAPRPQSFEGLDPRAVELLRAAASAVDAEPDDADGWLRLGMAYHAHRRFELARSAYEQALARRAEDARGWYYLALVEDQLGGTEAVLQHLLESRRLDGSHTPTHWRLGSLHLGLGQLERAQEAMQMALELAPHDAAALVGLARVRLQQGRPADAIELLESHLGRLPRDGNAKNLLGTAYRQVGRAEEAARLAAVGQGAEPIRDDPWEREMLSLRRGFRTDFLRAVGILDGGDPQQAIALLEKLREKEPEDSLVLINLHRAYRMEGELDRAIELLVEARRIDPLSDIVHLHIAGAYQEKARGLGGELGRATLGVALSSIQEACTLSPNYAAAHALHGDVLSDFGRAEAAAEAWLRAATLEPGTVAWQSKAGKALCDLGRWEEAVPVLTQLDLLQPDSTRDLFLLSAALANSGRLDEALEPLERARALAPRDPLILDAIADLEQSRARARAEREGG